MTKRENKIDSQADSVTDSTNETVARDAVISKERLDELRSKYTVAPLSVFDNNREDVYDVEIPKGLPIVCQWIRCKGASSELSIQRAKQRGYRFDLPKELYESVASIGDSPYAANKAKGNTIERGAMILAWRWKEEEDAALAAKTKELAERNTSKSIANKADRAFMSKGVYKSEVRDEKDPDGERQAKAEAIQDFLSTQGK